MNLQFGPNDTQENGVYCGDARELGGLIPDNSLDCIFTDPPYPGGYIDLFGWVAEFGARCLKPGGFLAVMSGKYHLDKVFAQMSGKGLDYYWQIDLYTEGESVPIMPRRIVTKSKPVILWTKGTGTIKVWNMVDVYKGQGKNKRYHEWGQDVGIGRYVLEYVFGSDAAGVVCDPFVGGGSTFEACQILGLQYLGFEIDRETAEIARARIASFIPPLFYLSPESQQIGMELGEGKQETGKHD